MKPWHHALIGLAVVLFVGGAIWIISHAPAPTAAKKTQQSPLKSSPPIVVAAPATMPGMKAAWTVAVPSATAAIDAPPPTPTPAEAARRAIEGWSKTSKSPGGYWYVERLEAGDHLPLGASPYREALRAYLQALPPQVQRQWWIAADADMNDPRRRRVICNAAFQSRAAASAKGPSATGGRSFLGLSGSEAWSLAVFEAMANMADDPIIQRRASAAWQKIANDVHATQMQDYQRRLNDPNLVRAAPPPAAPVLPIWDK